MVADGGKCQTCAAITIGKVPGKTAKTPAGMVLTHGLQKAAEKFPAAANHFGIKCGKLMVYAKYELVYNTQEKCRRRTYGAPFDPPPEQDNMNKVLARRTRTQSIHMVEFSGGYGRQEEIRKIQTVARRTSAGILDKMEVALGAMDMLPLQQSEIKRNT